MPIVDPRLIKAPGRHFDGNGLYLEVARRRDGRLSKSWLLRYTAPSGARRDMGLGAFPEIGLAEARGLALDARAAVRRGVDPIEARRAAREEAKRAAAGALIFRAAAALFIATHETEWVNEKHRQQWRNTLASLRT